MPNRKVVFFWKTDGRVIWGALRNCSSEPQQVLPRQDLILVRCQGVGGFQVPDRPAMRIPEKRCGREFLKLVQAGGGVSWLNKMKRKYGQVFDETLGTCKTHIVTSIPFKYKVP